MVYVIAQDCKPLMPCSNSIARLLLKQGKAKKSTYRGKYATVVDPSIPTVKIDGKHETYALISSSQVQKVSCEVISLLDMSEGGRYLDCSFGLVWKAIKKIPNGMKLQQVKKGGCVINATPETNFDAIDCVESSDIMQEYNDCLAYIEAQKGYGFKNFILDEDNNDGILFIDVLPDKIKYGFLDWKPNTDRVMTAHQYMDFDMKGWNSRKHETLDKEEYTTCIHNIKAIDCNENHELMSSKESELLGYK